MLNLSQAKASNTVWSGKGIVNLEMYSIIRIIKDIKVALADGGKPILLS
ncbi:hypothetical protein [Paenibacillus sp. FJAT-26967]|nr:hypothetical protein [Paenibacillus sp. FJAT-26967]